ncbi:hypothetical protein I3842_13G025400 [Carya illinoinensis]|uniref:Uncharacterized protein n=1 Tax=Carya illinoinensis TaxID=32201 RepID=A0A922DA93_CARIL|nr:hypothetical protein I3842_13G025400 [Carya illinoinensis]KAG6680126.1 hypothetical protein I3842_13G025400 [Carya illinoinensis]KAG6680127.1 hypothetical protein I3842_13G025400 [Carya illinoinensis]
MCKWVKSNVVPLRSGLSCFCERLFMCKWVKSNVPLGSGLSCFCERKIDEVIKYVLVVIAQKQDIVMHESGAQGRSSFQNRQIHPKYCIVCRNYFFPALS